MFFQRKPQYRLAYVLDRESVRDSRVSASLAGVRWDRRKPPWWTHRCWPQTRYSSRQRAAAYRCACGAWSPDGVRWFNRNVRRRERWRWLFQ